MYQPRKRKPIPAALIKKHSRFKGGGVPRKKGQNAAGKEDQRTRDQRRRKVGYIRIKQQCHGRAEKKEKKRYERNDADFFMIGSLLMIDYLHYSKRGERMQVALPRPQRSGGNKIPSVEKVYPRVLREGMKRRKKHGPPRFSPWLGHATALICHRHIIHYRGAATLRRFLPKFRNFKTPQGRGFSIKGISPSRFTNRSPRRGGGILSYYAEITTRSECRSYIVTRLRRALALPWIGKR